MLTNEEMEQAAVDLTLESKVQSDLDSYDYDLVFGVTLGAVNTQLKTYIDQTAGEINAGRLYFVRDAKQAISLASGVLAKQLEALKLFSIPVDEAKRTEAQQAAWDKACYELGFVLAYDAVPGFADGIITDVIDFEAQEVFDGKRVIYRPPFETFALLENRPDGKGKPVLYRYEQNSKNPWIFKVMVYLDDSVVTWESLPPAIQKRIRREDCGKLFSIKQLFLNTGSFNMYGWPDIFSQGTWEIRDSFEMFLEHIFEKSEQFGKRLAISYSLMPLEVAADKRYIARPVDYRYYVSPYVDAGGNVAVGNKELYTLNYVAISSKREFPKLRPLRWNWVDPEQMKDTHGALAIRRSEIMGLIEGKFEKVLKQLYFRPTIDLSMSRRTARVKFDYRGERGPGYAFQNGHISHQCDAYPARDEGIGANVGITAACYLQADVRSYNNSSGQGVIEMVIDLKCTFAAESHIGRTTEKGDGTLYHNIITCTLELDVSNSGADSYGKLLIVPKTKLESKTSLPLNIGGLKSIHVLNDCLRSAQTEMSAKMKDYLGKFEKYFKDNLDSDYYSWFIPGGETAAYSGTSFSDKGDLVFNMTTTLEAKKLAGNQKNEEEVQDVSD